MGGLLSTIIEMFEDDVMLKAFDWKESAGRELHVICNSSIEASARELLASKGTVKTCEEIFKVIKLNTGSISRCFKAITRCLIH